MRKIFTLCLVSFVLFFGACSKSQEKQTPNQPGQPITMIRVGTDTTFPPMEMMDKDNNLVGFDIDFLNAVAKEAGFKVAYKNTAWDGIFAGLDMGLYDAVISSVTITEERKKVYDFSDPYIRAGQVLVVRSNSTVQKLSDMTGLTVGAQTGTTGAFETKKNTGVKLKTFDEISLAFEDMASGRIDGVVCDFPIAANYALQHAEYKSKIKIAGDPFTDERYGVVVKKGNTALLSLINKGIAAVKAKGLDKELEKKWFKHQVVQ